MKTERNIFIAFILNLFFAVFEFFGGIFTGSVAILSDALHDLGDAASIGLSYFFENKSKKSPDNNYSYGYARYSVFGGIITNVILFLGSLVVVLGAIDRILHPTIINKDDMLIFSIIGVCVNLTAVFFTRGGGSFNQKSVNLHLLEDVFGWIAVFIGAVIIKFTDITIIDPIMSIIIAVFILISSAKNLKEALDLFLEKTPNDVDIAKIKEHLLEIDGVIDVHHIHVWSFDSYSNYATMHIVTDNDAKEIKHKVKQELLHFGISHATLELEDVNEDCHDTVCKPCQHQEDNHSHHHHHHHNHIHRHHH